MAFYDTYDYHTYWQNRFWEDLWERIALQKLIKSCLKRDFLIDIGGGFGRLASFYSPLFTKCEVIEPSVKLIKIGQGKNSNLKNLCFEQGSLPKLNLKDNSVDVALIIRVSHHLPDLI